MAFDLSRDYLAATAFRFMSREMRPEAIKAAYQQIADGRGLHIPDVAPQGSILDLRAEE